MGILSKFTESPKPMSPDFRYRMLVISLCLLAGMIILELTSTGTHYDGIVLILALLFYFVATYYAWPSPVNVILRILAWICTVFVVYFFFYKYIRAHSIPYGGVVLILALLFHVLAYRFTWPTRITVIMRVLAWIWIVFTLFYILYF